MLIMGGTLEINNPHLWLQFPQINLPMFHPSRTDIITLSTTEIHTYSAKLEGAIRLHLRYFSMTPGVLAVTIKNDFYIRTE
jgi:hypothetical protein